MRFRNIWLRELPEWNEPGPPSAKSDAVVILQNHDLDRFVGKYQRQTNNRRSIPSSVMERSCVQTSLGQSDIELVPNSHREFSLRWTAGKLVFDLAADGKPSGFTFHLGGETHPRQAS